MLFALRAIEQCDKGLEKDSSFVFLSLERAVSNSTLDCLVIPLINQFSSTAPSHSFKGSTSRYLLPPFSSSNPACVSFIISEGFHLPQKVPASSCLLCLGPLSDYYAIKPLLLSSERAAGSLSNLKKS